MRISLLLLALATSTAAAQRRPPVIYFEVGGEGIGLSANLDVGLTQSLRLRGGAGWFFTAGTLPVTASYLIGQRNSTFEVGAGATVFVGPNDRTNNDGLLDVLSDALLLEGVGTQVLPVGVFGWRYHPRDGAILRLTATPLLIEGRAFLYGGASLGFTF